MFKCSWCQELKPRSAFAADHSKKTGLQSRCRTCKKATTVMSLFSMPNPEKARQCAAVYLEKHTNKATSKKGCWLWTGAYASERNSGYDFLRGMARFGCDGFSVRSSAYVLAYEAAHNRRVPKGMVVMHAVCDDEMCVNPDHLKLGTASENALDKVHKGRVSERQGRRIPDDTVRRMFYLRLAGNSMSAIAREVDVGASHVSLVLRGRYRRDIYEEFHGIITMPEVPPTPEKVA